MATVAAAAIMAVEICKAAAMVSNFFVLRCSTWRCFFSNVENIEI